MKILIADDDPVSRSVLQITVANWGYDAVVTSDGPAALEALQADDAPPLAILDWMMPGMDGVDVCRKIREVSTGRPTYIILLTGRDRKQDLVEGLRAGADDYVTKPFNQEELQARLQVGVRVVELQRSLADRVRELEQALSQVNQLQGLLPICAYCKKIRDDKNYWQQVETYVAKRTEVKFSHGICPDCWKTVVEPELDEVSGAGPALADWGPLKEGRPPLP